MRTTCRDFLVVLCGTLWGMVHGHGCMHDVILERFENSVNMDTLTNPQNLVMENSRRLSSQGSSSTLFQPIRISFDISKLSKDPGYLCVNVGDTVMRDGSKYVCTQNDLLTADKKSFILNVLLPAVTQYFSNVLSVQRVSGNLIVRGIDCSTVGEWACCTNVIPPYLASTGIANTDFLIHVSARPTSGAVLAWALPCNLDQFGRPISGQANFGPNRLDSSSASRTQQIGTAIHELTHALGFSSSRFPDFRQPLNGAPWGLSNILLNTKERGVTVSKIITPKVVQQVKQQFNCYNWATAGGELENGAQGTATTMSSHWEKRIFQDEYMTATASSTPVYSAITLALFEDSGWYTANYSMAQTLTWGYLEGCTFATSKCSEWSTDYFCNTKGDHCTPTRDAKGYCDITTYKSSIPAGFQYFSNPSLGGQDSYSDYCPLYVGYSNGDCTDTTAYTTSGMGEILSPRSQCFQSTLSTSGSRSSTPACYAVDHCTKTAMIVNVGKTQVSCPMAGGKVSVPGFQGLLTCPPANTICQRIQRECSGLGVLQTDGTCLCNPGYNGADCSLITCPTKNGLECAGHGTCDGSTGQCNCDQGYTGLSCGSLICPIINDIKFAYMQCSNHGTCDPNTGTCTCYAGYTGNACQCIPGCPNCSVNGTCDCLTGSCVCNSGYYGLTCQSNQPPPMTTLIVDSNTSYAGSVVSKGYQYFKVLLNSSSSDITVMLNSTAGDADIYASFVTMYPNAGSAKATTFISNGNRSDGLDAVTLCGSLGSFPRGINDTFRFCSQPNDQFIQGAPGYFYIGVFGYTQSNFQIDVQIDKCTPESCSHHGICGKYYGGVCACDRFWSGEACNIPKCRPDCIDFNDCKIPGSSASRVSISNGLRNTTDCYGNGVCTVFTINGIEQPKCVCDPAYTYTNPTDAQSMCKMPIPSISYVQNYNSSFVVFAQTLDQQVGIGLWALYTITVKSNWSYFYVELEASANSGDALILVRKNTLPSLDVTRPYPLQFSDAASWAAMSTKQRILLTRTASTLSDGLLYIGVYNTQLARTPLSYSLLVSANNTCLNSSNICPTATSTCNANLPTMCECRAGFSGPYCDLGHIPHQLLYLNQSANTSAVSIFLREGEWTYLTFEVPDSTVTYVKVVLTVLGENDAMPLLMVRGPLESGFPSLDLSSSYDFNAVASGNATQVVVVPVTTSCSGSSCYKIAITNKMYAADVLQAQVTLFPLSNTQSFYSVSSCSNIGQGDYENCNGRGTCIQTKDGPQCTCKSGWNGLTCNSPNVIAMSTLWYAMSNASLLCSVCSKNFTLPNSAATFFTIPQSMQPNTGLEIRVTNLNGDSQVSPNIYVAQIPPRSIYDFTIMSLTDGLEEVVQLVDSPMSGQFWVAVYSEAPISMSTNSSSDVSLTMFSITSRIIALNGTSPSKLSVTQTAFAESVFTWLTTSDLGIIIFTLLLIFLLLITGFFVWRVFNAPDNQDSAIRNIANEMPARNPSSRTMSMQDTVEERPSSPLRSPVHRSDSISQARRRSIDLEIAPHPNLTQL